MLPGALLVIVAQAVPPVVVPLQCETPEEVEARVHYERAFRAELAGNLDEARLEATAAREAGETRFAGAAQRLVDRVAKGAAARPGSTGVGSRTELVITATTAGLYLGSLTAAAGKTDQKGAVALLMLGTGLGLGGSLIGSAGRQVPQSMPQMLQNGMYYGTFASLMLAALGDQRSDDLPASVAVGTALGIVGGLASAPFLTGGDSGAATTGLIYGGLLPVLLYVSVEHDPQARAAAAIALTGGTAGMLGAILYNHNAAHFSRGRWNLITLGGGVGALMGAGVGVLTDAFKSSDGRGGLALLTAGTALGVGLTWWLTSDFGADQPQPGAASLIHLEEGKVSAGNLLTSLVPVEKGAFLEAISARF